MFARTNYQATNSTDTSSKSDRQLELWMSILQKVHGRLVFSRRAERLAQSIAELLPDVATVIDLGCGDGKIGAHIKMLKPRILLEGYDVLVRPEALITVHGFDGVHIPVETNAVDGVIIVDVLHHTEAPMLLLRECYRVSREFIIIKDHSFRGSCSKLILRFMDWVGNRPHQVALPYKYWRQAEWETAWSEIGLRVESYNTELGLYPWPANRLFEQRLHFLAKLSKERIEE